MFANNHDEDCKKTSGFPHLMRVTESSLPSSSRSSISMCSADSRSNSLTDEDSAKISSSPFAHLFKDEDKDSKENDILQLALSVDDDAKSNNNSNNNNNVQRKRKKKKRLAESLSTTTFKDIYYLTGDILGEGSYGRVETCINQFTDVEYAVKMISKKNWTFSRSKVLKEVELYYLCQGQKEIIQLVEYFEEQDYFYLIFEKAHGGQLLNQIQSRVRFTEEEAASIIRELATALRFLHDHGIAHRDLKPENVLCVDAKSPIPVKLCDFDLCSSVNQSMTTPLLQSPVGSAEYMAPEVVNAFSVLDDFEDDDEFTYDKKCDLWSLGIIAYILLCGYLPFSGHCDEDCRWEFGEECLECQKSLFDSIRTGHLVFPEQHWSSISSQAKDLISKLLVKEASQRLDANGVLEHPWIVGGGSAQRVLETPSVLRRQSSVHEFISEFASNALAMKRNFETNPSFSLAFNNNNDKPMKRSVTEANFDATNKPFRKMSAQVHRKISGPRRIMRRQTSLIFPEENFNHAFFNR